MIPVPIHKEPADFDKTVRQPGLTFIASKGTVQDSDWKGREYWQRALPSLGILSKGICAYCATWIPHSTGSHSIDHFKSKSEFPKLAYEWSNFRYVSSRFNSRKGRKTIVDPQKMKFNWFIIDFSTFFIHPNSLLLNKKETELAATTIEILGFNDDDELVAERATYYDDYKSKQVSLDFLKKRAPFIAMEIIRQKV